MSNRISGGQMIKKITFAVQLLLIIVLIFPVVVFSASDKMQSSQKMHPSSYSIGSSDILEIMTWKEPDFTRQAVLVRSDGKISFPLLGDIQAAGLTPVELSEEIENGLKKYVENPYVTVHVMDPQSKSFYILGEIQSTGQYPLRKNHTVLQAIALAGGFTEWASKKEIILFRYENGKEKIYRINYEKIVEGKDFGQNFKLIPDDTIIVP